MLPFWISIGLLSLVQAAVVALPVPPARRAGGVGTWLRRSRRRWWALIPPASVAAFVAAGRAAPGATTQGLTYLALVGVPLGAVLAIWLRPRGAALLAALAAGALFLLAWLDRGGLAGEAAATALIALSCVALGTLLAELTSRRWLALGILAMAAVDTALVASDLLQAPNRALIAAHPAGGLPQLQSAILGSAAMGYGDLFIAGLLGGLLALHSGPARQMRGALLVAVLALCFDLLFFAVSELPATVPVALALIALEIADRRAAAARAGKREARAAIAAQPGPHA